MRDTPATADEWCEWGLREQAEGRLSQAVTGFRRALAIQPGLQRAQFALAQVLIDLGDLAGAAAVARQVATDAPGAVEARWLAARLAMADGQWEKARDSLQAILSTSALNEIQTAEASLLLGLALGELGDTGGAFAAAARGKALQRRHYAPHASARESEPDKFRRLTTFMDRASGRFRRPVPTPHSPAAGHVFLLGFPRSGTTLLEQVLAANPHVRTLEEEPLLAAAYEAFLSSDSACASLIALDQAEAEAWADHYWRAAESRVPDLAGKLFVDKQPAGTVNLPVIARLFPHAKILFATRDPRDVVLSCFRQPFQMNAMTFAFTDLGETANCYDACMTFAELARARLGQPWLDARHEALVEDFDSELDRILSFLELAPDDAMSDVAAIAKSRPIRTPSATQVRAGLNRRGLGRWRDFRNELASVLPTLAPWVDRFGYAA